jgi:lysophospholipase L1-like esterase
VRTFVALGDSTTAGYGDPDPAGGGWRGWAALLAAGLPGGAEKPTASLTSATLASRCGLAALDRSDATGAVAFHNLATSGARAADVARAQLPAALALRPDVAAVLVGVNDTLRGDFDPLGVGSALSRTVGALREAGAVVLTGCLPDPGRMFRLPAPLARPLGRRIAQVNTAVHRVAAGYRSLHLHIPLQAGVYDRRMWSIDRLHPGERGHRMLAGKYYDLLRDAGYPVGTRPSPEPTSPPPTRLAQAWWMLTKGSQWLYARSTDLVPHLAKMAWIEWRSGAPAPLPGPPTCLAVSSPEGGGGPVQAWAPSWSSAM